MKYDLAFVHTSPVHIETFSKLTAELAPHLKVKHVVAEALLNRARTHGVSDELTRDVQQMMTEAGASGAQVVVCTCSSIGGMAEATETSNTFRAMRIDRAMADLAVNSGQCILVVAALESTLKPTRELLLDSAQRAGVTVDITELVVAHAWAYFENGDQDRYLGAVADAIRKGAGDNDVVVLAQASMARAADQIADSVVQILSSPRIGVQAAIDALELARR